MYSIFFDEINTKMYPSGMLHKFGVNGKVSGSVGAAGEIQGDIMIMLHGAEGCAYHYRNSARRRHQPFYDILSSDLTDRDIVYGGIEKLKRSVRDAWERYSPELIIIVPTPVSDVLSDDIITCAEELRGEGINCISVQSELFSHRDKNYAKRRARELARQSLESDETLEIELNGCGFTELLYALVGQVMEKQPVIPHSVNIETVGWGSEGKQVLREIGDFLGKCGVTGEDMAVMRALYGDVPDTIAVQDEAPQDPNVSNAAPVAGEASEINHEEEHEHMEIKDINVDQLRAENPALLEQIQQSALSAERQRIEDIDALTLPGYEDMAENAKKTGISAMDFQKQIVAAQKKKGAEYLEGRKKDAEPAKQVGGGDPGTGKTEEQEMKQYVADMTQYAKEYRGESDGGMY